MYCATKIAQATSTGLNQETSKGQFNNARVLGVNILGNMIPVVYNIPTGPGTYKRGPVFFNGTRRHLCFLYEDEQYSECCRLTLKFNIDYYKKCYIQGTLGTNGAVTTPYRLEYCNQCGKSLADSFGDVLSYSKRRYWWGSHIIYRPEKSVQPCASCGNTGYRTYDDSADETPKAPEPNYSVSKESMVKYVNSSTPVSATPAVSGCGCGGTK